jgi:hypothetical protein
MRHRDNRRADWGPIRATKETNCDTSPLQVRHTRLKVRYRVSYG